MSNTATQQVFADNTAEIDRNAYNAAFDELGLSWYWDASTHRSLAANPQAKEPALVYLETEQAHLLRAYEADFLVNAIQTIKARCQKQMTGRGA
jgi:hypothetical protein